MSRETPFEQVTAVLPEPIRSGCLALPQPVWEHCQEIRLTSGQPVSLYGEGRLRFLGEGALLDEPQGALEAWLTRAAWEVEVLGAPVGAAELSSAIEGLRQEGDLTYLRGEKEKHIDLSQALVGFSAHDADGSIALALDTRSSNAGALRPLVLVEAALARLGEGSCDSVRVRRCGQWHEGESGCLVKPL